MQGLRVFARRIDPGTYDFEHEKIVFVHQPGIGHHALQIGIAFPDQRWFDPARRHGGQAAFGKLVDLPPREVAATYDLSGQFRRRNIDHALPCVAQRGKTEIATADHAAD